MKNNPPYPSYLVARYLHSFYFSIIQYRTTEASPHEFPLLRNNFICVPLTEFMCVFRLLMNFVSCALKQQFLLGSLHAPSFVSSWDIEVPRGLARLLLGQKMSMLPL